MAADMVERVRVLERAIGNCFMMAKRQIASHLNGTSTPAKDLERWQHVLRFCETTGSKSDILRGQLPTEITEGSHNPAAVTLGRLGGLAGKGKSSPAKAAAARRNGAKGGRPRKPAAP